MAVRCPSSGNIPPKKAWTALRLKGSACLGSEKDKAGAFWLVTVPDEARVDLKALPNAINCARVSFGKAEDMERLLGISPGSVTALAAINDSSGSVRFVLDANLAEAETINCHPLRNSATLSLSPHDLIRALTHWRHAPIIAAIPVLEST